MRNFLCNICNENRFHGSIPKNLVYRCFEHKNKNNALKNIKTYQIEIKTFVQKKNNLNSINTLRYPFTNTITFLRKVGREAKRAGGLAPLVKIQMINNRKKNQYHLIEILLIVSLMVYNYKLIAPL